MNISRKQSGGAFGPKTTAVSFQDYPDNPSFKSSPRGPIGVFQAPLQNSKIKNKFRNMPGGAN